MANRSKAKGTRAETTVVRFLEGHGVHAERRALKGRGDEGDVLAFVDGFSIILEVKAGKQTASPSRSLMDEWKRQTKAEMDNARARDAALVVATFRASAKDYQVYVVHGRRWLHMYLDEFIDYVRSKGKE